MTKQARSIGPAGAEGDAATSREAGARPAPTDAAEMAAISALSYEDALEQLESLVRQVEDGELSLEEGIAAHRRAVLLLRHCEQILDRAQVQIEEISGRDLGTDDAPE